MALLALAFVRAPCHAADTLSNNPHIPPAPLGAPRFVYAPGVELILPDGSRAVIEEVLPDGTLRADGGQIISPEGIILTGPDSGKSAAVVERKIPIDSPDESKPDSESAREKSRAATAVPEKAKPETAAARQGEKTAPSAPEKRVSELPAQKPQAAPLAKAPSQPARITIAELLPTTAVPENPPKKETPPKKEKVEKSGEQAKKPDKAPPVAKPQAREAKPAPKEKKAPEKARKYEKPAVGQELRIPPEAVAKGDLEFLEGCWQGTRPEYFSKRTIRECFCFDGAGIGKRRVFDPSGGRMCIGATKARLSSDGVLSVTSQGAACSDGERWGSAEMVCRNSGPKTPCSWVFRDANNGRQAYTIPFVRVQSCAR